LIIIGAARSGTKFLRDTLAADRRVFSIPYDVNHLWRMDHDFYPHDEIPAESCDDALALRIRRQLFRAAGYDGHDGRGLLIEKTVSNCLRVDFVDRVFPRARFVHLVRDGRAVVESAYRQWIARPDFRYLLEKARSLPLSNLSYLLRYASRLTGSIIRGRRQSSWGPRYAGIDEDLEAMSLHEVCAVQWARCVERAIDSLGRLSAERVLTTRYEDLATMPAEIEKICEFVGLTRPEAVIDAFSATARADFVDEWRNRLDADQRRSIEPLLSRQLERLGYG